MGEWESEWQAQGNSAVAPVAQIPSLRLRVFALKSVFLRRFFFVVFVLFCG